MTEQQKTEQEKAGTRRGARRALWGAGIAAAFTAVMMAVTLPSDATGVDRPENKGAASSPDAAPSGAASPGADTAEQPAPTGEQRTGRGPLTATEVDRARTLALGRAPLAGARGVTGKPGPEYLDTDLADSAVPAGDEARRVEVLFYDYGADKLVMQTVNLTAGTVERTDTATGVQPPPSPQETTRAADLLVKSPEGAGLRADFKAATKGKDLTGAAQLLLQGISYNTAEQAGPASLSACGTHRCVRLFTQVKGGPWIDTTNLVIDLSAGTVGRIHP
ncbi:Tat pathway signal sequence domain protein [Streptomyces sp. NPDC004539]|uniref:Tat pathway signal sequence domain protein n=1 Tax=Streptomyces sp. NPDC004539 TaxID=3154280 RepID=UPI0033B5EF55